jgi:hypothetical protein
MCKLARVALTAHGYGDNALSRLGDESIRAGTVLKRVADRGERTMALMLELMKAQSVAAAQERARASELKQS